MFKSNENIKVKREKAKLNLAGTINYIEKHTTIRILICVSILCVGFYLVFGGHSNSPLTLSFLGTVAYLNYCLLREETLKKNTFLWVIFGGLIVLGIYIFTSSIISLNNHAEWDFTVFYLFGKVAATGHNLYSPHDFNTVLSTLDLPFKVSDDFIKEIVNVGFWYPPQTIFYFYPLGLLSFKVALISWTVFNLIFFIGCIYIIYNLFFKPYGLKGLIFVSIVCLIFFPVKLTLFCSQTNFILLFYLLLIYKYRESNISGIFLALAVVTKPYMIIFIIYPFILKKWKIIIYFLISSLVIVGITVIFWGVEPFLTYLFNNPANRMPQSVFLETVNQSFRSVLLRRSELHQYFNVIFSGFTFFIVTICGISIFLLRKKNLPEFIFPILLITALLLYPTTLDHYGVLLLFIIFQLLAKIEKTTNYFIPSTLGIAISFYLSTKSTFLFICFLLIIYLAFVFRLLKTSKS